MDFIQKIRNVIPRHSIVGQFARYLFTGGLAFIVDFGLFALFLYIFKTHYLIANLIGLIGGLVLNYIISIIWVFAGCKRTLEKKKSAEFLIFAIIGFIGVGLNQLLMFFMVDKLDTNEMISKMVAAVVVLMWNFLARKILLFKNSAATC